MGINIQETSNKKQTIMNRLVSCLLEFGISREEGFTLIELLIVFSVIAILTSVGVASYVSYSKSAQVDSYMKELKTTLFTARSRALSQLRDSSCYTNGFTGQNYVLQGYQVVICCSGRVCRGSGTCNGSGNNYELQAVYANTDGSGTIAETCQAKANTVKSGYVSATQFGATNTSYIFFSTITGAVTSEAPSGTNPQLSVTGYGITKIATVSATGVIQ